MSEGNDGYYFDQQAADDAAYEANMLALEAQSQAPAADINSLYQDLLGRAPDPTGIAANAGASADTIRESILASPEYNNQNVNTIYQDLLGRAPDPTGIAANVGATPEQIRQSIFGSAEYQNQSPPSGFFDMPGYGAENAAPYSIVGDMLMQGNQLVYNVTPIRDDSGHISGYSRADTGEYVDLNKLNKSITGYDKEITDLYENLLGRAPDVSEVIAYNQQLKSGEVNLGDVYQGFMQSPERLNRVMPFLDPNADVNTKFEQGVRGFDAKGLAREGYLEGLPTHYVDPKTGKLVAWFGTLGDSMQTDDYTWHTVDELRAIPDAKVYLAQESQRDVGKDWRTLATKAATIVASMAAPQLMAYLAPSLTTGSVLADAAIQSAVMQGGKSALSGGDLSDILRAAGTGAVTSAAGSVAGDYLGDLAGEYLSGGLSDADANALMGDYTSSPSYNDYIDYRSVGDSGDVFDTGEGADYIEPAANKAKRSLETEATPVDTPSVVDRQFYDVPPTPVEPTQLDDLLIPTAENYDMPEVDLTAGVPEQNLADQIITNPDVPISDVLSNLDIITLLKSGTSAEGIAGIIGAIGGGAGGGVGGGGAGGGGAGGGGSGGGAGDVGGGGLADVLASIVNGGAEESTDDEETKKKKKQQQTAALAAIEAIAARTPPGAQIDYLYDIGGESIFAPMRQQTTKPKQDWAYEPNDRFAQGGMVAFDEGGDVAEVKPYDATVRDKYAQGLQEIIEGLGAEKGYARGVTRSITGGEGSKLPLGLGVSDFVPFLGTGMQTQEAVRSGEAAIDSIKRGEYGRAALEGGLGLLGLVPGLGGTARVLNSKLVQNMGRAGEKYLERALPPIMDRGGLPAELIEAMATGTQSKMLIGSKAAGIDPTELKAAKDMLDSGVSPMEVWEKLLWARAPDGRMVKFHSTANADMLPMDELLQKQADTIYNNTASKSEYLDASLIAKKVEQGMSNTDAIKWFESEFGRSPTGPIETLLDFGGGSKNLRQLYDIELQNTDLAKGLKLEDVYNDPEIFKHYPALKDIEFRVEPDNPNYGGYYSAGDQQIAATPQNLNYAPKELTVHELSHAINDLEGRPRGASVQGIEQSPEYYSQVVSDASDKLAEAQARMYATHPWMAGMPQEYIDREIRRMPEFVKYTEEVNNFMGGKTPTEKYMRELGETEARMAEFMQDMTPNQAREFYPFHPQNFETATGVPLSETWHKSHGGIIDLLRSK